MWFTLSELRNTTLRVPKGPLRSGRVGPNNATTGTRNAAARCMGPVSPPMKRAARRVSAINSPTEHFSGTATPPLDLANRFGEPFFPRTVVDHDGHSALGQRPRYRAERFGRPALRAPARAGIQDREWLAAKLRDEVCRPRLRAPDRAGKGGSTYSSASPATADASDSACSTTCAPRGLNGPGVEHACRGFARLRRSDSDPRAGRTRGERGANRALKIERHLVLHRADFAQAGAQSHAMSQRKTAPAASGRSWPRGPNRPAA